MLSELLRGRSMMRVREGWKDGCEWVRMSRLSNHKGCHEKDDSSIKTLMKNSI